jgi:hypothetical protein
MYVPVNLKGLNRKYCPVISSCNDIILSVEKNFPASENGLPNPRHVP